MGAMYEIQWLCDEAFLVFQDESTGWQMKKKKLTEDEVSKYEDLYNRQCREMNDLCEKFKPVL